MSSLIVAADLDLLMLEISIEQLAVPRVSNFDAALLKKTVVMFRLLDRDWTSVYPQRTDYHVYRGSNFETEPFNGGVSVVFPIPQASLDVKMEKVDLQLHVSRALSKYFELESSESVGVACIDVSDLFNGVIDRLRERKDDEKNPNRGVEHVAKSSKDTYALLKEDGGESAARATVYLRLTHLGRSVISEIEVPDDPRRLFYAREETSCNLPYQFREISIDELTGGCWGSDTLLPPRDPRDTVCRCDRGPKDTANLSNVQESLDSADPTADDPNSNSSKKTLLASLGKKGGKRGGEEAVGENQGKGNKGKSENGNGRRSETAAGEEEEDEGGVAADDRGAVSCLLKPALCGREGTCNKKDKQGRFGKCGKPDGEGGNPLACGERRKCARRKMAAGSATVGIVDKKISCPPVRPPNVCPCPSSPARSCAQPPWPPCTTSTPCSRCRSPVYPTYAPAHGGEQNFCSNYETQGYLYGNTSPAGCRAMHVGWR